MLRTALPLTGRAVLRCARQPVRAQLAFTRFYADKPSIHDPKPPVLPGSASSAIPTTIPKAPGAVNPSEPQPAGPAQPPPPTPPTAESVAASPPKVSSSSGPPPTPTQPRTDPIDQSLPPPRRHRFRNFLLTLVIISGLSFGGGVWYSGRSDNFHDFFTEYVPFGEQAVAYLEERQFRQRFPSRSFKSTKLPTDVDEKVTIPSRSGLSWRVAEGERHGSDLSVKGRHMSAVDSNPASPSQAQTAQQAPHEATGAEKSKTVEKAKSDANTSRKSESLMPEVKGQPKDHPAPGFRKEAQPESHPGTSTPPQQRAQPATSQTGIASAKSAPSTGPSAAPHPSPVTAVGGAPSPAPAPAPAPADGKTFPEVNEPSVFVPLDRIDPLSVKNADEPLVQDLVKVLNDIILVANADNSTGKFSGAMNKAKDQLANLGQQIIDLKEAERQAAEKKIKSTELDFDNAAKELVKRLEGEMEQQEGRWREEFDAERSRLQHSFDEKLKAEVEKSQQISDEKIRNQLLEQALALKREFSQGVREHVETERQGRLSKLVELSTSVNELQSLTDEWNKVLDASMQTQHLINGIEAVRTTLETADRPKPFARELAALSEIAGQNEVVDTALSSISPAAYGYGIPTSAQLVDRFRRVADEVRKAALLPENAGMASHATSYVLSKLMFKKEGRVDGNDVESVLLRTENLLEEGRLDDAAREMNSLTGWAKTLSSDWLTEVRRVLEVKQALEVVATEARLQSLKVD